MTKADDDLDPHLDVVLIGGQEEREIQIVGYSEEWPLPFETERQRIRGALGETARRIEHIGSTAVPGLVAKAILDIMVTVVNPDEEAAYVSQLERSTVTR